MYFCDTHSPWQRGTNENMNGLLGDYFPKRADCAISPPNNFRQSPTRSTLDPAKASAGPGRLTC